MTRAVLSQFASLTNPTLPNLDADFVGVANTLVVPCTVTGTNSLALTPIPSTVTVSAYTTGDQYTFVAAATSTGVMTAQVSGLGFLKIFTAGGTTQASTGDVKTGQFYQIAYQSTLDTGAGGFVIVSAIAAPSVATVTSGSWTPSLVSIDGNSPATTTYQSRTGVYTKVARLVTAAFTIQTTNASGFSGNAGIGGLPFVTTAANSGQWAAAISEFGPAAISPNTQVALRTRLSGSVGSSTLAFTQWGSNTVAGGSNLALSAVSTDLFTCIATITYETDL